MSGDGRTPEGGPLVVACLRITDLRAEVDPLTGAVAGDTFGLGLSTADGAALEHALRLAGAWSGRVLAVASGPPAVDLVLRSAVALGVDTVRLPPDEDEAADPAAAMVADERRQARAVAGVLAARGPLSVVVCGDRSVDRGTGAFPAFLAHELGAAQALGLVALAPAGPGPGDGSPGLVAERRLDGGWRERLRVPLPAVCSVEAAGVRLRRAPLAGVLDAGRGPVAVARPAPSILPGGRSGPSLRPVRVVGRRPYAPRPRVVPPPAGADPRKRILTLTGALDAHDPPALVGPVTGEEAADRLLEFLGRHGELVPVPDDRRPSSVERGAP